MIYRIIIGGLAALLIAAFVALVWSTGTIDSLKAENVRLGLDLRGCKARNANIEEDRKSDASVLDPGFVIPPSWFVQPDTGD